MKKALSLLLAAVLMFGTLTVSVSADVSGKITDVIAPISDKDYTDLAVKPGKVYELPLTADLFEWEKGNGKSDEPVSESKLNSAKITVKVSHKINKGKNAIEKVEIASKKLAATNNEKTAYIKVEFVDEQTGVNEIEFDFTIYLYKNGSRISDSGVQFSGTLSNPTISVETDEDYVDISGGEVVEPDGYIRSIECYLGAGVIVKTKMYENKKYYGTAEEGITEKDEKITDAYPEIELIYTLNTVNLSSGTVIFELDDEYHVYDENGKYVGTTDDELKYSSKFYLASEKINMTGSSGSSSSKDDDDDEDDDDDDEDKKAPVVEEDDEVPVIDDSYYSVYDNPNTGAAGPALGILGVTCLAALAILVTNSAKRR